MLLIHWRWIFRLSRYDALKYPFKAMLAWILCSPEEGQKDGEEDEDDAFTAVKIQAIHCYNHV